MRFFEIFEDVHAQPHTSRFTYRRAAFFNTLKSKTGLMVARAAALRTNINELVQGVAMSTAAVTPFRSFVQTPIFSVSPSSFSLQRI